jgi:hypothetical protein
MLREIGENNNGIVVSQAAVDLESLNFLHIHLQRGW